MKKFYKALALLICLLLTLSVVSINVGAVNDTLVSDDDYVAEVNGTKYTSLSSAKNAALSGDTVTLLNDVTMNYLYITTSNITLDLNGYTFTSSYSYYSFYISSDFTIKNGTINESGQYGIYVNKNANLTLADVDINATGNNAIYVSQASVTVDEVNITSTGAYGIFIYGGSAILNSGSINAKTYGVLIYSLGSSTSINSSFTMNGGEVNADYGIYIQGEYNATPSSDNIMAYLTIIDGKVSGNYYGIAGNANYRNTQIDISGGSISGSVSGIYHPQWGILNISGGTISGGYSALELRAGTLKISGGTFTATETYFEIYASINGVSVVGAAVAISQHNASFDINVTISGGTFKGIYAFFEQDLLDDNTTNVYLTITDGTFISTGNSETKYVHDEVSGYPEYKTQDPQYQAVYSENCTGFISGGTYQSEVTYDNNISLTIYDLDPTYVSSSSIAVYVNSTDTTYVGTVAEINTKLNDLYDDGDIEVGDIVTVYVVGDSVDSVALTGLSCVKIVNLTDDTVTINGLEATSTGITTHPYAVYYEEVEATCTEEGSSAYYYCSICDHYFEDKDCQIETTVTYSDATGHDWDYDNVEWTYSYDEDGNVESATGTVYCLNDASHILTFDADIELYDTSEDSDGITYTYKVSISDDDGNELAYTYFDKYVENQVEGAVIDDGSSDEETGTTETTSNEASETTDTSDSYSIMLYMVIGLVSMYGIKTYRKREEN